MGIAQKALEGNAITDCFLIDCHMHNARVPRFYSGFREYENLIAQMDTIGINVGICSNLWENENWARHTEIVRMWEEYAGRFYGYLSPNPNFDNFKDELRTYGKHPAFVGIKLHPTEHHKDLLCKEYCYTYDFVKEYNFPVLLHTWGVQDIMRFHEIAPKYSDTVFILGHSGGSEEAIVEAIHLAAIYENVYLETSSTYVWHGAIEAMVRGASARKILFGSDACWTSMESAVGRIALANIAEEDKHLIFGGNAKRIFHHL